MPVGEIGHSRGIANLDRLTDGVNHAVEQLSNRRRDPRPEAHRVQQPIGCNGRMQIRRRIHGPRSCQEAQPVTQEAGVDELQLRADAHAALTNAVLSGSWTVTQSPPAARGVRVRVPSCALVMLLTIARPRPTPAWSVRMRSVPRRNGSTSVETSCGVSFSPVFSTVSTALLG